MASCSWGQPPDEGNSNLSDTDLSDFDSSESDFIDFESEGKSF